MQLLGPMRHFSYTSGIAPVVITGTVPHFNTLWITHHRLHSGQGNVYATMFYVAATALSTNYRLFFLVTYHNAVAGWLQVSGAFISAAL